MYASQWILKKLKDLLKDSEKNLKQINDIFRKYPDDYSLQNVQKLFTEYRKKPGKAKLEAMEKKIDEIAGTRKFEASGGTRLWFGDRRKTRGSQMIR